MAKKNPIYQSIYKISSDNEYNDTESVVLSTVEYLKFEEINLKCKDPTLRNYINAYKEYMKLKFILKISIALMCCSIFMFNFIGCNKNEKGALEYLSNKYGQEFELDGNLTREGNDEFHPSPIKSTKAWPKNRSDEVFTIKLNSGDEFEDNYQNILMKSLADEYLINMIKSYWNNCKICTELSGGFTDNKFSNDNILNFLVNSGVVSDIYIFSI